MLQVKNAIYIVDPNKLDVKMVCTKNMLGVSNTYLTEIVK